MIELREISEVRDLVREWRKEKAPVGLVMTMGALHRGHLSLIEKARARCGRVIATIFVNPLQFGPSEDYARYPRSEAEDLRMLKSQGCDAIFLPQAEEMFPRGDQGQREGRTLVQVRGITSVMDGPVRPGHFAGVATIVLKMLNIVGPDEAYFGEKDYQQYEVISAMAQDLCVPARMVPCPTVREPDGLALSSRNTYLSAAQRAIAPGLYATMREAARELRAAGAGEAGPIAGRAAARLLAMGFDSVDYLEFRDGELALAVPSAAAGDLRLYAAAWLGGCQLTDNILVTGA